MLFSAVIAAVLLAFLQRLVICQKVELKRDQKIVVIGAGASGIAAASKLFENGFMDVTILEAENRIGGRIQSIQFGEYVVDLGAQWVHGVEGNAVFDLAWPYGLLEKSNEADFGIQIEYINSDGEKLNDTVTESLTNFFFQHVLDPDDDNKTHKSICEYVEKKFEHQFNSTTLLLEKIKYLNLFELMLLTSDPADCWCDLPFANSVYKDWPGDQIVNWKNNSYSVLLDILMKKYPNPENELPVLKNTIFNAEVTSIDFSRGSDAPVVIKTSNGEIYMADHAIVTVSLGVLKDKLDTFFIPHLPQYKINTINGLEFGSVAKIYLLFERPILKPDCKRMLLTSFLRDAEYRKSIENQHEKLWTLGVYGVTSVEHKPKLLELWVGGVYARMVEGLSDQQVLNHTVELLHRFLKKNYEFTEPISMLRSKWYRNSHFRGTYSYRSLETVERNVWAKDLEQPLLPSDLKILFAGEATSSHRYGNVDAAVESGWNVVNKLIQYYENATVTKNIEIESVVTETTTNNNSIDNNVKKCHDIRKDIE